MIESLYAEESKLSYYGWTVVGVVLLANLTVFGLIYSFTVFFKPLASEFSWSRAATAGVFSTYAFTHNFFSPLTGRLNDQFGPRIVALIGGLCLGLAMLSMSRVDEIWEAYIFYTLIFGFGVSSVYGPMTATASQWFTEKRGLAMGIAAVGAGGGSLIFSPLCAWLVSSYGWRNAYAVVGIISWGIFIPIVKFIKRVPVGSSSTGTKYLRSRSFSLREALRTAELWTLAFIWLFMALALFAIMIHIIPLLTDRGVPLVTAGVLTGLIGGTSIIGRISGGFFSDRIGRKRVLLFSLVLQMIALIWVSFSRELWMFFLFAVLFGFSFGGWAGIIGAFPADFFGIRATGTILGFILIFPGMGAAIGPYIGGLIFDITCSYYHMIWVCILATFAAIILGLFLKSPNRKIVE